MIATSIRWKENARAGLPETVEVPIGVEMEWARQRHHDGVIKHWLELTFHWGVESMRVG